MSRTVRIGANWEMFGFVPAKILIDSPTQAPSCDILAAECQVDTRLGLPAGKGTGATFCEKLHARSLHPLHKCLGL